MLLGLRGRGAVTPPKNSQFGFWQLVLSWLCHFKMIPLGQCSSKFANRDLEGNARGKRGGREMERRETPGSGWLVFLFILNFSYLSLYGEGQDAVGFASGGDTWTILRISSPKPRDLLPARQISSLPSSWDIPLATSTEQTAESHLGNVFSQHSGWEKLLKLTFAGWRFGLKKLL